MPGIVSAGGVNTNNPNYTQFFKTTQIPHPAEIFVFLDEHPDSIDDGYFLNKDAEVTYGDHSYSGSFEWHDLPASYHNNSAAFSFADGHSFAASLAETNHHLPARTRCRQASH